MANIALHAVSPRKDMGAQMVLFIKSKPCQILILLRDTNQPWHAAKLAAHSGASYIYTSALLARLSKEGMVSFERKGRSKFVKLTEKGVQLASLVDELMKKLDAKPIVQPPPAQPEAQKQTQPAKP